MIPFSQYFEDWLYGEGGYYTSLKPIGKSGDFYTSVSSSKFFGGSIASRVLKTIQEGYLSKDTFIVEIGAHQGYLLADIIEFIFTLEPELLKTLKFGIVEKHKEMQRVQKEYFLKSFGFEIQLIHFDSIEQIKAKEVFFISNEIFDAFPTQIIANEKMLYVDNDSLVWGVMDSQTKSLANKYNITKGEVCSSYQSFVHELLHVEKFEFVSFDYGDKFPRNDISMRIYKSNQVFPLFEEGQDLTQFYKNSDITYDVNFELLIGEFESAGIKLIEYKTQAAALIDFGFIELLEILEKNVDFKTYTTQSRKAKILIDPSFLGERFKMVRFRK